MVWLVMIGFQNIHPLNWLKPKRVTTDTAAAISSRRPSSDGSDFFQNDDPLENPSWDRLGRHSFSQMVAQSIAARKDPSSYVVGIYGEWGQGKTTVINFIERELENNSTVVCVRFDPWYFEDQETMLRNFFRTLAEALGSSIYTQTEDIGKWLQQYMAIIAPVSLSLGPLQFSPGKIAKEVGETLSSSNITELRKRIENSFIGQRKRIVIMVDDIDRLDNSEIQTVFKLIKLCADFPYTTYVVALDEDRVASALQERYGSADSEGGRSFIEKIIQLPLNLPKADTISLRKICLEGVDKALGEANIQLSEETGTAFAMHFVNGLEIRVQTPRMAKRYGMDLSFSLPILKNEVNTVDFMLVEGLRLFYPHLYDTVQRNPDVFLGSYSAGSASDEAAKGRRLDIINNGLEGLTDNEKDSAKNLIKALFPRTEAIFSNVTYGGEWEKTWDDEQRVASSKYFQRFFSYTIPEGDISDAEIASLLGTAGTQSVSEIASNWRHAITAQNVEMVVHKLRTKEDKLDASTSSKLALALASLGDVFPNPSIPFSFTNPFHQAAILIAHLVKNVPEGEQRLSLGKAILQGAEPVTFAAECLVYMRTSDEKDQTTRIFSKDEEQVLEKIMVSRIRDVSVDNVLYRYLPEDSAWLFSIWAMFGSQGETDQHLTESFQSSPENVVEFLRCYLPTSWGVQSMLPRKGEFTRESYDSIARVVNPDNVFEALKQLYGKDLERLEHKEIDHSLNEYVAKQFACIHRDKMAEGRAVEEQNHETQ